MIDANLPVCGLIPWQRDDVINSIEYTQALVVTGSSTGLAAGAALTVVINSVTYGATVLADGTGASAFRQRTWLTGLRGRSILPSLALIPPEPQPAVSHPVTVNLAAVAITINTLSTDDVINAAEKALICSFLAPPPAWKQGRPLPLFSVAKLHHHGCRG